MQRALMHYFKPCNRQLVLSALKKAGREDLIGWGPDCLISPYEKKTATQRKPTTPTDTKHAAASAPPQRRPDKPPKHPERGERQTGGKHNRTGRQPANGRKTR